MKESGIEETEPRDGHFINIILILGGYTLFRLFNTEGLFSMIFRHFADRLADLLFYCLTFLVPIPALLLFWRFKQSGFALVIICVSYSLTINLNLMISELHAFGTSPVFSKILLLIPIAAYGCTLQLLCSNRLRKAFRFSWLSISISILAGGSIALLNI